MSKSKHNRTMAWISFGILTCLIISLILFAMIYGGILVKRDLVCQDTIEQAIIIYTLIPPTLIVCTAWCVQLFKYARKHKGVTVES